MTTDVDRAVAMAQDFHEYHGPRWPFSAPHMREVLEAVDYLKVSDKGFVAGILRPLPMNPAWLTASELFWWQDAHLIRGFRRWAIENGANEIFYHFFPGSGAERYGHKRGRVSEVTYSELV